MSDTTTNQQNQTVDGTQINAAGNVTAEHIGDVINQAPKPPVTFPLHDIALPRNHHFTGRTRELERIHTAVQNGGVGVITQAIAGLGGVGKTQLAAHYAHTHLHAYDLIYWLPAENETVLMEAMAELAYRLQLAEREAAQPQAAARAAAAWLENSRQRWLLIVDNADLPQMTPATVRRYLPTTGNGAVLISSRNSEWGGWRTLQLDVFTDDEAVAFMESRLGEMGDERDERANAIALARELGGLALALEHAIAYVESRSKTVADYLRLFRARQKALWAKAQPPADYQEKTITTTWTIAFESLPADAGALLNLCAFFAPDGIPTALLATHADRLPPPLDECAADELRLDDAIAAAKSHALLSVTADGLHMHRLVQLVAQARMTAAQEGGGAGGQGSGGAGENVWLNAVMALLAAAWPFDQYDMTTWDACPPLHPHLLAAAEHADQYSLQTSRAAYLNWAAARYLKFFGSYPNALPFYQRDLAIREKLLADDPDNGDLLADTATSLNDLAELLRAMGKYGEARPFYERALAIWEKQLGADHTQTAIGLNNLGLLLQAMGEYGEARPFYERALAIWEKQLGADHTTTAIGLNNLGGLLESMGEYGEARPFYERALAIKEKTLPPDHPSTATSLNNLGALLKAMGEYGEARPFYERALAIFEKQLGSDHPNIATLNNNLGALLKAMGEYGEARPFYERALAIDEKALGPDHPDTAIDLNNLGGLLYAMGEYGEARPFFERALAITEKQLGSDHPATAIRLNNLGGLLDAMGEYGEARPFYERALAIREKTLPSGHPDIAQSYNNLAALAYNEGDKQEAVRLMRLALTIYAKALGDAHPATEKARQSLAFLEAA